jgi:tetratricopeptide (TPR) repeat protein
MTEVPLKGNIKNTSLIKILVYLNRSRKTGTLVVITPAFTKKAYLSKGDVIFSSSTFEDDRLGEMLIKAEKITMEQYDKSVEILKKKGKRLGAILVELGYITPKDLFWGVKYQVKEIIYSLFLLEDADYEFIEGDMPSDEIITLKMSMGNLIYDGVKRIDNWTRIRNEMPVADNVLKLSSDPATLFQDIELGTQDRKMLSIIDGKKTIKEIIENSWIGSFEGMKILYALWAIGVIEEKKMAFEPEEMISLDDILQPVSEDEDAFRRKVDEVYATLDTVSADELLEVNENDDEETIKKNYYRLTREFHPDRYFSSADPAIKDKLTSIFDALTRAFSMLRDSSDFKVKMSGHNTGAQASDVAEERFKRGIELFKKGDYVLSVESFRSATELNPDNAKYWSYLSLALSKIPNGTIDAAKALLAAIQLEPKNADHYANLGMVYLREGLKKKANEQFQNALKFDPGNMKAKKGLEKSR